MPHDKTKKRAPRKMPLALHPLTVDEALAISLEAGPLPEKAAKRAKKGVRKQAKQGQEKTRQPR